MFALFLLLVGCSFGSNAFDETDAQRSTSRHLEPRSQLLNRVRRQVIVDQGFKDDAITAHNKARFSVSPKATNMHEAVWNEDLALTAQNYANKCIWKHNRNMTIDTNNRIWSPSSVNENLYWSRYEMSDREHIREAVRLWDEEKQYYDYDTMECSKKPCGHYEQVVWHNSANVGCGIKYCSSIYDGKTGGTACEDCTIVVCNYGPGGNIEDQRPYSIDPSVTPCTNNPCLHGGICSASGSSYTCSCTSAYTGVNCHVSTICATSSCQNGGSCKLSADATSYTCSCAPGFIGSKCETAVPCQALPCQNGGTCKEDGATYTCSCESGFVGTNCEIALTTTEFRCGFETDMCGFSQRVTSFDWIRNRGTTPSPGTGPTSASEGQYYVYTEVSGKLTPGSNAVLTSGVRFGDGTRCLKFDYAMYGSNIGQLDVLAGDSVIWSLSGDQGNQWTTVEVQTSQLAKTSLSFKATYGGGWQGDIAIDNIIVSPGKCSNPCATQPCQNGGTCNPSGSSYDCSCTSLYVGDNCERESACGSQPCNNGGTCTPSGLSFTCTCTFQFTGPTCDTAATTLSSFDCDFENDLCGLVQLTNDDIDFTLGTATSGPVKAKYGTGSQYIFISNSMGSKGQHASIETSTAFSVPKGYYCVKLLFNIKGDGYIQLESEGFVFSKKKRDTQTWWYTGKSTISDWLLNNKKLVVKAVLGTEDDGFVAIDNLSVTSGRC